ncbi:MAG TPA: hypothetical protein VGL61_03605 [Kofleriaceae bacterium]
MLICSATYDVLRCAAFALIVLGVFLMLRRFVRMRPTRRAELPLARTGDQGGVIALRAFAMRVAPVVLAIAGVAALATTNRFGHRALVLTDRAGAVHAEHYEFIGTAKDLDPGDVWIVNRTSRPVACNHMPLGDFIHRKLAPEGWTIEPGQALAVMFMPTYFGPDQEPPVMDGGTLWVTWAR